MKATSIFGGVQVIQIIISIIRSKFIAVLLGPSGMGIASLLIATTGLVTGLTNFGLGTSAVRDISNAKSTGNSIRISITITVFRRLVVITGGLGFLITLVFSPWLSQITFGNKDYTWAFIFLSITLLLNQVSSGQGAILRGMRQIGFMAKSSLIGSLIGLFTTIPLYYVYGLNGIVPAIIITAIVTLFLTWYYARKLNIKPIYVSKARTVAEGKGMMRMGFLISLSGLITLGTTFIIRVFISNTGGVEQAGLYNAGMALMNTYVGLIFTSMSMDYYPRLSAVSETKTKSIELINQQAEIAILVLAPIILIFIIFINEILIILYSDKFISVNKMIIFAGIGTLFKAVSWSIAFLFLAKGASRTFFINELASNIYFLGLSLTGYYLYGLTGIGISSLIGFVLYAIQVFFITHLKYSFILSKKLIKVFGVQLILSVCCLLLVLTLRNNLSYGIGSILILLSLLYSYNELKKRLSFNTYLKSILKRK